MSLHAVHHFGELEPQPHFQQVGVLANGVSDPGLHSVSARGCPCSGIHVVGYSFVKKVGARLVTMGDPIAAGANSCNLVITVIEMSVLCSSRLGPSQLSDIEQFREFIFLIFG